MQRGAIDDRSPWPAFLVCGAVIATTTLDLTKINVALPSIDRSLEAADAQLQLLVTGFILAFGLTLVPAGRFGDVRSRKAMLTAGLVIFALASMLCAMAPSIEILIIGRVLQGIAAGTQMPQALGLVQRLFAGRSRARAFGHVGGIIAVSTAIGPAIGGSLTQLHPDIGWRLMFAVNVPIATVVLVGTLRTIPSSSRTSSAPRLDTVGLVLFSIASISVMLPFVSLEHVSTGPLRWLWLAVAALAAVALALWEHRYEAAGKMPVLPSALMTLPSFRSGLVIMATFFASISAIFIILAIYLQDAHGATPLTAGLVNIPQAITSAIGAAVGARFVHRSGRRVVAVGLVLAGIGMAGLIPVAYFSPPELVPLLSALTLAITGAGTGLAISPNQTITIHEVSGEFAGVAASLTQIAQRIGMAIGVAVTSAVYFGVIEAAGAGDAVAYRDAIVLAVLSALAMLVVALVLTAHDIWRNRRSPGLSPGTET